MQASTWDGAVGTTFSCCTFAVRELRRLAAKTRWRQQSRTVSHAALAAYKLKTKTKLAGSQVYSSTAVGSACATEAKHAVVIGGGVGGLAAAGRLAKAGLAVTLLEKNAEVGGRAQSVWAGPDSAFRFDTGPSLLLFPDKYREGCSGRAAALQAFEALGITLDDEVELRRVEPAAYRVWFAEGGCQLDLLCDEDSMAEQLEAMEVGAGGRYRDFLRMASAQLRLGVPFFIEREVGELVRPSALLALLPLLATVNPVNLLGKHIDRLQQFFKDPRLLAAFSFQDLYVGLSPYTAPAVFSLLAGTELVDGVWYPMGGFGKVAGLLRTAAEGCGVEVRTGAEVVAVEVGDSGAGAAVRGVRLRGGEMVAADVVLCNRDLPAAYDLLAGQQQESSGSSRAQEGGDPQASSSCEATISRYARQRREELAELDYSAGVIAYNWSVGRRVEGLLQHNVFLSGEYVESWQLASTPSQLLSRPNFYVHAPSRTDPSAAPEGMDSIMVLLPVASMQQLESGSYEELIAAGRQRILDTFEQHGLGDVPILDEFVIAPPAWQARYGLKHGAAFGLAHGLNQLSIMRPSNADPRVQGLYFVGASTRPGNGVPLCLIGAKLTAERILKDLGR